MRKDERDLDQAWPRGWDGHERAQLLRMARLSLAEKLEWLEQAHRLALHLQGARTRNASGTATSPEDLRRIWTDRKKSD